MGDSIFGFVGKDYVLLVADAVQARSIVVLTEFEDKILPLDSHKLFAMSGEHGDRIQFSQYIQKNLSLYYYRNNLELTTHAAANYTRRQLADALRQNPYQVNILLGGFDKEGPSLYFLDYLASMHKVPFGAHGYAGYFIYGLLDKLYKDGLSLDEGVEVARACVKELQTRMVLNSPKYLAKIVDSTGTRVIEL
jgi:20S proteasome subunit beta 4